MSKNIILTAVCILLAVSVFGQKHFSKTAEISFHSTTPIEDIEAISNSAYTVFDLQSGKIQWAVLIKSFKFEKALMQEHFNENYMESSKYPKAKFKGTIADIEAIDFSTDGTYVAELSGVLEIRGVEQQVKPSVTFQVENGVISGSCKLKIVVEDFGIEIPSVVKANIAKEIDLNIKANYEVLAKS